MKVKPSRSRERYLAVAREPTEVLGKQQIIPTCALTAGFSECACEQRLVRIQPSEISKDNTIKKPHLGSSKARYQVDAKNTGKNNAVQLHVRIAPFIRKT